MKILPLTANDGIGEAARAAYRIHKGLVEIGVSYEMLVQNKNSNRTSVTIPCKSGLGYFYTKSRDLINRLAQKLQRSNNSIFHSSNFLPSWLYREINASDADIVHMHWINREMISIKEIKKIRKLIAVFGNKRLYIESTKEVKTQYFGTISKNRELALLYFAADVMAVPSLIESFGQTVSEAMACFTLVVAFNISGLKDIVKHRENGYLASPYDAIS